METNHKNPKPHAILIPYPLQGHVIPFVNLAIKLASSGFTVTFVNTRSVHHQITTAHRQSQSTQRIATDDGHGEDSDIFAGVRKITGDDDGVDIRYTTVGDGFPLGFDRSLNHDQFMEGVLHVFSAHVDELVGNLIKSDPGISCLITDTFYVWSSAIANKYNLVNISFWTEPALVFTLYYHMDLLRSHGHFASADCRDDIIDYVPGVRAIKRQDLMSYLQATDTSTVVHRIIQRAFDDVKNVDFIICNTVHDLESETLSALHEKQPTYAIGPMFSTTGSAGGCKVPTSLWSESECTPWLDTKPRGSVLYVSFGSYAHVEKDDIVEIALGLLESEVSFIWVVRPDIVSSDETDFLPVGFAEGTKDRGLIVSWCCQTAVISHSAIGGFLTHCGWNSILESIWCTVPLLCFPLLTDQFTNRKLVVDDWKIGLNLCDDQKSITKLEVSKKINRLMGGKSCDELRVRIKQLRKKLEDAISTDGSSEKNFNQFISGVKLKITSKRGSVVSNFV